MHILDPALFALVPGGQGGDGASGLTGLLPILIVFAIFYFLLIRPQSQERKRHEEMLKNLSKGDRVVTSGGIYGTITGLTEQTVKLRIADKVTVQVTRSAIGSKLEDTSEGG